MLNTADALKDLSVLIRRSPSIPSHLWWLFSCAPLELLSDHAILSVRSKEAELEAAKVRRSTCLRAQVNPVALGLFANRQPWTSVPPRAMTRPYAEPAMRCRNSPQVDGAKTGLQLLKQSHQNISDISETLDNVSNFAKGERGVQKVVRMEELAKERNNPLSVSPTGSTKAHHLGTNDR